MKGPLDNITILRYAHVFRQCTSGGAEQYLKQLNQGLLVRNEMTILQMHLVNGEAGPQTLRVEHYGLGRIIWLPVNTYNLPRSLGSVASRARWIARETSFLSRRHHSPRIRLALGTLRRLLANSCGHLRHSIMVLSERLIPSLKEYSVDLVAFHWLSYDVGTLVAQAEKRSITPGVFGTTRQ